MVNFAKVDVIKLMEAFISTRETVAEGIAK